jgi:LuxR family maltose regulon positive regulatory protein
MYDENTYVEGDAILQLKLEVPRQPSMIVERPRLRMALATLGAVPLVLVVAPPGFGKTILLAQWREHLLHSGSLTAWLTLDESDGTPRRFLVGIIYALRVAGLDVASLVLQAERGLLEVSVDTVARGIHRALSNADRPIAIFLDDYHRAGGGQLDALLGQFVGTLPEDVRLFVSSRVRPEIDVSGLLVRGAAYEFSSNTLRFTAAESRQVLDPFLGEEQLSSLISQIEGWPVAVQLARALSKQEGVSLESLSRLTARGGHLSAYLTDQILSGLPEESVNFLLETSILERFNVAIIDLVRERSDSWQILETLSHLQSFLTPLDGDNIWFRYHHLFADCLLAQLRQRRPSEIPKLHLRASNAFEQSGDLAEAVRHARDAGDFERCATLIEAAGGWRLVLFGGMSQLGHLLNLIPQSERLSHPRLLVADAYLSLKAGDIEQARSTFDLVAKESYQTSAAWKAMSEYQRDALAVGVLLKTYEDNDIDHDLYDTFCELQTSLADADGLTRGVLECAGAVAALALGKFEDAEQLARDAMGAMRSVNSMLGLNYCYLHAGVASFYKGELRTASAYLGQAQAMAVENFGADSGLKAVCDILIGGIELCTTGEDKDVHSQGESFSHVYSYDGWFEVYAAGLDTRFRLAIMKSSAQDVEAILVDGGNLARTRGLKRLAAIVDAYRVIVAIGRGAKDSVRSTVALLGNTFSIGCWRTDGALWRPYQDVGQALAMWFLVSDPKQAKRIASDLVECAKILGAKPFAVRALLLRALINQQQGLEEEVTTDLRAAVDLSIDEKLLQPYLEHRRLASPLSKLRKEFRQDGKKPLETDFLSQIIEMLSRLAHGTEPDLRGLSLREHEVMQELARGQTNKEIARSLDMTDHTVKFHLKNIFTKLGVDRRAHALTAFRRGGDVN